jgi:hypothetical protein
MATSITDVIADTVENWIDGKRSHQFEAIARRTGRKDRNDSSIGCKHGVSMLASQGGAARQDFNSFDGWQGLWETAP